MSTLFWGCFILAILALTGCNTESPYEPWRCESPSGKVLFEGLAYSETWDGVLIRLVSPNGKRFAVGTVACWRTNQ